MARGGPLRSPGLRRVLAAQTVGPVGDAMATTALVLHLQGTTGTATSVGLLLFVQAIPPIGAPLAGVVADRLRPSRLLAAAALVQAAVAALLALWLPSTGPLLALVLVLAVVESPLGAAVGRTTTAVVDDRDLPAANALRAGARELGTVLGPPVAGVLFATGGVRWVLALDAVTFLLTVPLVLRLPDPPRVGPRARSPVWSEVAEGLAVVWRTPVVRALAVGFWVAVLLSAAAVGLLAGMPLVGPVGRRVAAPVAVVGGLAVMGAGNLLTAAAPWLTAAFAAQVVRGLALPVVDGFVATAVQRDVPARLLGRALANVYGGVSVAAALGVLVGGPVVDATSPRAGLVVAGLGGLGGAWLTAVLVRRARSVRRRRGT